MRVKPFAVVFWSPGDTFSFAQVALLLGLPKIGIPHRMNQRYLNFSFLHAP
jgi:hypothetical protein